MGTTVVFTGGGSGGLVFPGIAVIERLKAARPDFDICWIGSGAQVEREIVARFDIPFYPIPSGKLRRYLSVWNFFDLFKIVAGLVSACILLLRLRPALVFSKGGYVSVPPVVAARLLGIPVYTHDSDVDPGLATKINARFAEKIFVAYQESCNYFPLPLRKSVVVVGNPVRTEILSGDGARGKSYVGAPHGKLLLLVLGGSLGARQVNELADAAYDSLSRDYFIVHQTGSAAGAIGIDAGRNAAKGGRFSTEFLAAEYADVLAAADLVVSRAGGGTLWEIASMGKPSILIPLDTGSSRGDQLRNAERFEKGGASVVLAGPLATPANLAAEAGRLARHPVELLHMGAIAKEMARTDAAGEIARMITERIGGAHGARPA